MTVSATDYVALTHTRELEALNWMRRQVHNLGLRPETACINMRRPTGSNYGRTPMPMPFDPEDRERYFAALKDISTFVFSTGSQCMLTSRRMDEIKAELDIPDGITWDALVGLVTLKNWSPRMMADERALMSAWAFFLSNPRAALFGR